LMKFPLKFIASISVITSGMAIPSIGLLKHMLNCARLGLARHALSYGVSQRETEQPSNRDTVSTCVQDFLRTRQSVFMNLVSSTSQLDVKHEERFVKQLSLCTNQLNPSSVH
jgi:hypothetical protein